MPFCKYLILCTVEFDPHSRLFDLLSKFMPDRFVRLIYRNSGMRSLAGKPETPFVLIATEQVIVGERNCPGHHATVIAPIEAEPRTVFPRLILHGVV